jgi:hypothetical protein
LEFDLAGAIAKHNSIAAAMAARHPFIGAARAA